MENEMSNEPSLKEKVMNNIVNNQRTVSITFPKNTFKKFHSWAEVNAAGCYWLAIEKLMMADELKLSLAEQISLISDREFVHAELKRLDEKLPGAVTSEKVRHTFGRKEE